jgi:dihydrofolate reductase
MRDTVEELFVCGGGELYRAALPHADRLYITRVAGAFEGDTLFPPIPAGQFQEVSHRAVETTPPCAFVVLDRVR